MYSLGYCSLCSKLVFRSNRKLVKRNVDCMTEKLNILKESQVPVMHLLSQTTSTGHNLKWDHFIAKGRSDTHCKIKETLLIQELKPTLNDNVSSEKLYLY